VFTTSAIYFSLEPIRTVECDELFVMTFIIFVLSRLRTNLLAENHLIIQERNKFDTEQKFEEIMLVV